MEDRARAARNRDGVGVGVASFPSVEWGKCSGSGWL